MNEVKLKALLQSFLIEDIGDGDITSEAIFSDDQNDKGVFIAKENGIVSGLDLIKEVYGLLDNTINVSLFFKDGDRVEAGNKIAEVSGPVIPLLKGERVILNLLQRMSGIATITETCIETLNDPSIQICDTRKTVPGLRMLDKYAVTCGGGQNHRQGLYDAVMIKDNHISFAGSITKVIEITRRKIGHMVKIEVETETKEEVQEAIEAGADVIMLDNRSPEEIKELKKMIPNSIVTEASGGITLNNLAQYRNSGVDVISLGFLTHSVKALDISLQVNEQDKKYKIEA
ncbi:carboxylating nicotinate-nucleotide diphosphorylase [Saliterribacillus persicus]|uniref:Probable nicotinate-nucleotide pyrophosphorylase [carboxylating] n=1 Tax=Saliterribacillus persicus TaxID=930114 RepID=A0A368XQH7_9BACI|nr:carboxylating nicotinate-nucleotide diphosphorylase [Saliterribacillus persicus]RCW69789.1 nicotinate-nucleotide pyrophosphorylase [carboxylating] [Saliterribacillus persicus]